METSIQIQISNQTRETIQQPEMERRGEGIELGQHKLKKYINITDAISLLSSPRGHHSRSGCCQLQCLC